MVYLLHFDRPFSHARHFIGVADSLHELGCLLLEPAKYATAPILRAAVEAGIPIRLARTWFDADEIADTIRRSNHTRRFCPVCTGSRRPVPR